MAQAKKGGSAIKEVGTRGYTLDIHQLIHEVGFKKWGPQALREIWKFAMKEMGTPDVHFHTRLNKAVWAKGIGMSHTVSMCGCPESVTRMKSHQTSKLYTKSLGEWDKDIKTYILIGTKVGDLELEKGGNEMYRESKECLKQCMAHVLEEILWKDSGTSLGLFEKRKQKTKKGWEYPNAQQVVHVKQAQQLHTVNAMYNDSMSFQLKSCYKNCCKGNAMWRRNE
eukprot:bmy_08719T0